MAEPELEPRLIRHQVPGLNACFKCVSGKGRTLYSGKPCLSSHHILFSILGTEKPVPRHGEMWALKQNSAMGIRTLQKSTF